MFDSWVSHECWSTCGPGPGPINFNDIVAQLQLSQPGFGRARPVAKSRPEGIGTPAGSEACFDGRVVISLFSSNIHSGRCKEGWICSADNVYMSMLIML